MFSFVWKRANFDGRYRGHVILVTKNKNNQIVFYDTQTNLKYSNPYKLLYHIKYYYSEKDIPYLPKLLRIDDKEFNTKIMNQIAKPTEH